MDSQGLVLGEARGRQRRYLAFGSAPAGEAARNLC
jgi:hypothetical protein